MKTWLAAILPIILLARVAWAKSPVECVTVESSAPAALVQDAGCALASHPLAAAALPDLGFAAPLCFVTSFTDKLLIDGRATDGFTVVAYSGLSSNSASGAAFAPMPAPLTDAGGDVRPLIPFAAATIIEVRPQAGGKAIGQLVSRDTGWAELDLGTGLPKAASERLVVTHGAGRLFRNVRGEIFFSGDQFGAGGLARGSLCGPKARRIVERIFRQQR